MHAKMCKDIFVQLLGVCKIIYFFFYLSAWLSKIFRLYGTTGS